MSDCHGFSSLVSAHCFLSLLTDPGTVRLHKRSSQTIPEWDHWPGGWNRCHGLHPRYKTLSFVAGMEQDWTQGSIFSSVHMLQYIYNTSANRLNIEWDIKVGTISKAWLNEMYKLKIYCLFHVKNGLYALWILFLLSPAISGSAVAIILGKGFLAIRKAGHLCVQTHTQDYSDYSGREKLMEVRVDVLKPGTRVC